MKLKVCGIKENPERVAAASPDYLGFIFWEPSPRYIAKTPKNIPEGIDKVGVFVDAPVSYILERIEDFGLSLLQLHGKESPEFCADLRKELQVRTDRIGRKISLIKVFSVKDTFDFKLLEPYEQVCDYFLFDTKGKLPGGNGYAFDWQLLKNYPSSKPYFLSGGIGLDEVPQLIRFMESPEAVHCHALDVNSRFEIEPGVKNIQELLLFKTLIFENK